MPLSFWEDVAEAVAKVVGDHEGEAQEAGWVGSYVFVAEVSTDSGELWLKTVKSQGTPTWRALGMLDASVLRIRCQLEDQMNNES